MCFLDVLRKRDIPGEIMPPITFSFRVLLGDRWMNLFFNSQNPKAKEKVED